MFSGIVEDFQTIVSAEKKQGSIRIKVKKPSSFNDLNAGDSIAVNGICLTVEDFNSEFMTFTLAAETLQILGLGVEEMLNHKVNLERSMRLGDRIHGSLVTGHVESTAEIVKSQKMGDSWLLSVLVKADLARFIWKKGSVTLHGVNLTVNEFKDCVVEVCLIPETIKRTNLTSYNVGQRLNVEPDYFAKAMIHSLKGKSVEIRDN